VAPTGGTTVVATVGTTEVTTRTTENSVPEGATDEQAAIDSLQSDGEETVSKEMATAAPTGDTTAGATGGTTAVTTGTTKTFVPVGSTDEQAASNEQAGTDSLQSDGEETVSEETVTVAPTGGTTVVATVGTTEVTTRTTENSVPEGATDEQAAIDSLQSDGEETVSKEMATAAPTGDTTAGATGGTTAVTTGTTKTFVPVGSTDEQAASDSLQSDGEERVSEELVTAAPTGGMTARSTGGTTLLRTEAPTGGTTIVATGGTTLGATGGTTLVTTAIAE